MRSQGTYPHLSAPIRTYPLRLSSVIKAELVRRAKPDGKSFNQFVATAVGEKPNRKAGVAPCPSGRIGARPPRAIAQGGEGVGSNSCRLSRSNPRPGPQATARRGKSAQQHQAQRPGLRNAQIGGDVHQKAFRSVAENQRVRTG